MVREQHFRPDHPRCVNKLFDRHGVGLIARHEGDINVFDFGHLRNVFGVACDVDSQSVEGKDEAIIPSLGMELLMSFGSVVGGNGLKGDVGGQLQLIAIGHHRAIAEHFDAALVGDQLGVVARQHFDGGRVEMVVVLMGDEEVVRLGHRSVVDA